MGEEHKKMFKRYRDDISYKECRKGADTMYQSMKSGWTSPPDHKPPSRSRCQGPPLHLSSSSFSLTLHILNQKRPTGLQDRF
ncbi:hypothetical protein SLE2022_200800 [Rubroshorea leprosula]